MSYAPPVIDQTGFNEDQGTSFTQAVTTVQPDALLMFWYVGHGNQLATISSSPALDWQPPVFMNSNSGAWMYWAFVPNPGTYTISATLAALDHFKIQWMDVTGWGTPVIVGYPFGVAQKVGPTAGTGTMSCDVLTTQPNSLVIAYFEQEPEAVGPVLNTYTPIAPFVWAIDNQGLLYSEEEALLQATFASPVDEVMDILQSSTTDQWQGSTIEVFAGPPTVPPPPTPTTVKVAVVQAS